MQTYSEGSVLLSFATYRRKPKKGKFVVRSTVERSFASQDAETGRREIRKSGSTETEIGAPAVGIQGAEVLGMRYEEPKRFRYGRLGWGSYFWVRLFRSEECSFPWLAVYISGLR